MKNKTPAGHSAGVLSLRFYTDKKQTKDYTRSEQRLSLQRGQAFLRHSNSF